MAHLQQASDVARRHRFGWGAGTAVVLVTIALYAGSFDHGFLASWDDGAYLIDNPLLQDSDGLRGIWSRVELPPTFPNYPLVFTSFWIEARLFDLDPRAVHVNNILLHALGALLCLGAARSVGLGRPGALLVALLFAVHPMQVESVAWATERKNVLSGVFWFAAFVCFRRFRATARGVWYAASLALFLGAMLSKTTALTLPLSLWLADGVVDRRRLRDSLPQLAPMLVVGALFGWLTTTIEHADESARAIVSAVELPLRPFAAASALTFYVRQLIWPGELLPLYPRFDLSWSRTAPWLLLGGWLAVAVAAVTAWRRVERRLAWGLGHFVVTLAPVIGWIGFDFLSRSDVGDRFVYLACFGLFVAVVSPVEIAFARAGAACRSILCVAVVLALALLSHKTWTQQRVWRDDRSLWEHGVRGNPSSFDAQVNLARVLHAQGEAQRDVPLLVRAATRYQAALELRPRAWRVRNNLANLFASTGNAERALEQFARALEIKPDSATLHANRAAAWIAAGRLEPAIDDYRKAIELEPGRAEWYRGLGELLLRHGHPARGADWVAMGRRLLPDDAGLALLLARCHAGAGRYAEAVAVADESLALARSAGDPELQRRAARFRRSLDLSTPAPGGAR